MRVVIDCNVLVAANGRDSTASVGCSNAAPLLLFPQPAVDDNDGVALLLGQQRHSIVAVGCPL